LVLGVGAAFLIETLDNGFATGSQIEQTLGLAHIGTIPHLDRTSAKIDGKVLKPQDYVLAKPFSSFAEGFRGLRTSILLSNVDNPPRIVLFTSSLPNEGKTTSSICFARMAAVSGVKTILIDVDLRHPSVADSLMLDHQVGLIEVLAGTASPQEAIVRDAASGLDLITLPKSASNIQDLLNSEALRGLLKRLAAEYELIVLDSPPVLPVADARILSQIADKTVFVVRWQETAREAAVSAIKSLRSAQADIAGSLLAQVDLDKQRRYGYYGSDVYYYGKYKKYYDD
jgi:capsular exopolysaccharide synthesis family protein